MAGAGLELKSRFNSANCELKGARKWLWSLYSYSIENERIPVIPFRNCCSSTKRPIETGVIFVLKFIHEDPDPHAIPGARIMHPRGGGVSTGFPGPYIPFPSSSGASTAAGVHAEEQESRAKELEP